MTTLNGMSSCLLTIKEARDLRNMEDSRAQRPFVEKTKGVKLPLSTFMMRAPYSRFFWLSCLDSWRRTSERDSKDALGCVTRTSKKASCCRVQKPRARISRRASLERLAVRPGRSSPSWGKSTGSVSTSGRTSVRTFANKSLRVS